MMYLIGIVGFIVLLVLMVLGTYTVVEPNKAHVVVSMGTGRKTYHPAKEGSKSSYFFFKFLMNRIIVSLENVKHEINNVMLHDSEIAPFVCDITCWFKITDPSLAAEKLDVDDEGNINESVRDTLNAQVQGVARAAAMGQEVIALMKDRQKFGDDVFNTVNGDLDEWGVQLVKLEIIDFKDSPESKVISDYQDRRQSEIASATRQKVAVQNKEAKVIEADSLEIAGIREAEANREVEKANIEKNKQVGVARQEAEVEVARQAEKANVQIVEAKRTLEVGNAEVAKEAIVEQALGEAEATLKKGTAEADVVLAKGTADATVIQKKGEAQAIAKDKMADALKKFNDSGITLEQLKAYVEIQKSKFNNLGMALKEANVNLVSGGEGGKLFGFDVNADAGAGLAQMVKAFEGVSGKKIDGMKPKEILTQVKSMLEKKKK